VTFVVAADSYDRFMGRYSEPLAPRLADFAGVTAGQRVLDVGCGPGALTTELVARLGTDAVAAVDPSEPFVEAARERHPGVGVQQASAEDLPFEDDVFDAALAQLVVHFMSDPVAGLREMARVTRPGGMVAACVWDHAGGTGPVSLFWRAAGDVQPGAVADESDLPGARAGHLVDIFEAAGLRSVQGSTLSADLEMATFDAYWEPFNRGVGPAGAYLGKQDDVTRTAIEARARDLAGPEPFVIPAKAWVARGVV